MTREEKNTVIEELKEKLDASQNFYLTDTSGLSAVDTADMRKKCYSQEIQLLVVKNTLLKKALEKSNKEAEEIYGVLKGATAIMFSKKGNAPAKLIKELRKKTEKPYLKAAFIDESTYIGDENLDFLSTIKSKEELIGDIISILQSPMKTVLSSLQSGSNKISGIIKTLSNKEN